MKASTNELHPIAVKPQVWNLVGMDLIGPLKKTSRGNRYILTMTCYFSKWVEAFSGGLRTGTLVSVLKFCCKFSYHISKTVQDMEISNFDHEIEKLLL